MANSKTVMALHGFTGNGQTMASLTERLNCQLSGWKSLTPDLPGHGENLPAEPSRYRIEATCDWLADLLRAEQAGPAHLVGYSMGGRIALAFAVRHPRQLASLTLISASPGIATPKERNQRQQADEQLARQLQDSGTGAFVERWMNLPMWRPLRQRLSEAAWEQSRQQRLSNTAEGLARSLTHAGSGAMQPLWDKLAAINIPTLLVCGLADNKFVEINRKMAEAMPEARLVAVGAAGHAVHLERPDQCAAPIAQHLAANANGRA